MGRNKEQSRIDSLLFLVENGQYEEAIELVRRAKKEVESLGEEEARRLYATILSIEERPRKKKQEIEGFISNRNQVKKAYLR